MATIIGELEIQMAANIARLTEDFAKAKSEVGKSVGEIKATVREGVESMHESLEQVTETIEKMKSAFMAATAVFAGGEMFEHAVETSQELGISMGRMAATLGISTQAASTLKEALGMVGVGTDDYMGSVQRLTMQVRNNEERMNALGMVTRDANGNFVNTEQLVQNALSALMQFKEGTDRNLASSEMFGRSWAQVQDLLRLSPEVMEEAKKSAQELGLSIGPEQVEASRKYQEAMAEVHSVIEGIENAVGNELMPGLTRQAQWFRSIGPEAITVSKETMKLFITVLDELKSVLGTIWDEVSELGREFLAAFSGIKSAVLETFGLSSEPMTAMQFVSNVFKVLEIAVIELGGTLRFVFEGIRGAIEVGEAALLGFARIAEDALSPSKWGNIKGDWESAMAGIDTAVAKSAQRIQKTVADTQAKFDEIMQSADLRPKTHESSEGAAKPWSAKGGKGDKDTSLMPQYEKQLAEMRQFYMEKNGLRELDKQQELTYWQQVAAFASTKASPETSAAVEAKIAELKIKLMKEQLKTEQEMSAERLQADHKAATDGLESYVQMWEGMKTAGKASEQQLLEAKKSALAQQLQLDIQYQADKLQLELAKIDKSGSGNQDEEKIAAAQKTADAIAQIQVKAAQNQIKLDAETEQAINKQTAAQLAEASKDFAGIEAQWDKTLVGMMQGTTTWQKAHRQLLKSILGDFDMLGLQMIQSWMKTQAQNLLVAQTGYNAQQLAHKAAVAMGLETEATADATSVGNSAVVAGAGAAAQSAPFSGWGAVEIGAGVMAAVLALRSSLKSASGGYDVPAGVNPMTQLHAEEMVLPAPLANRFRKMTDGGGSGGDIHHHYYNINAMDAPSFQTFLNRNGGTLMNAIQKQGRAFNLGNANAPG
jgi:hypothetical protein